MILLLSALCQQALAPMDYRMDVDLVFKSLKQYGAYAVSDGIDLDALKKAYRPKFELVDSREKLLVLFESLVGELHDFHASLGTNNGHSPRLVPSGTDLIGRWDGERAFVEQVRPGSLAQKAGVVPGDEVLTIQSAPVRKSAAFWFGVRKPDERGWDWALNSALAGRWDAPRALKLRRNGVDRTLTFPTATAPKPKSRLTVEQLPGNLLYLRPEDSLGDENLINDFDRELLKMRASEGVILDLRNTGSGGTSSVARGVFGLFISKRLPYQRHRVVERNSSTVRDWIEYATPRTGNPVQTKLVVLVGRWTGSMGEGMAIGFDAMKRGTVIGTRMAGLRGAVEGLDLPKAGFRVYFPTEEVFHINGTPRHEWVPPVVVKAGPGDPWMATATRLLRG